MDPGVAAALVSGGSIVVVAGITATATILSTRKTRRAVLDVHDEVRTNHGKTAGEHIEGLEDALADGLRNMGQVLADALADHTASDAVNFEELRTMILAQDEHAAEREALRRAGH